MATDRAGQLLGLAFAVMLVGASFAGAFAGGPAGALSPVEPAEAYIGTTEDCTNVDFAVYMFSAMLLNRGDCALKNRDTIQEIKDGNKEQERADLYQKALSLNTSQKSFLTTLNNSLNDARGAVWLKVQARMVEVLENQTDVDGDGFHQKNDVRLAAREVVRDYYLKKQLNLLADWNRSLAELEYMVSVNANESLGRTAPSEFTGPVDTDTNTDMFSNISAEVDLVNGSTHPVHVVGNYYDTDNPDRNKYFVYSPAPGSSISAAPETPAKISVRGYKSTPGNEVYVENPDATEKIWVLGKTGLYREKWAKIEDQTSQMLANVNTTANSLYSEYVTGEVQASEFLDATAMASEWSTNYSQTGQQSYAAATLASAGLSTPNLSDTGNMIISYQRSPSPDKKLVTVETTAVSALEGSEPYTIGFAGERKLIANPENGQVRTVTVNVRDSAGLEVRHNGSYWSMNSTEGTNRNVGPLYLEVTNVTDSRTISERGLLFADEAPPSGWQVNTTYNTASLNASTVMWAAEDGGVTQLEGEFTVQGAQTKDGSDLQAVEMREYSYRANDFSELQNVTESMIELREEQQQRLENIGGGGGGGDWLDFGGLGLGGGSLGIVVLAGGAFLLLARE
jgi:hypothetical protein